MAFVGNLLTYKKNVRGAMLALKVLTILKGY